MVRYRILIRETKSGWTAIVQEWSTDKKDKINRRLQRNYASAIDAMDAARSLITALEYGPQE